MAPIETVRFVGRFIIEAPAVGAMRRTDSQQFDAPPDAALMGVRAMARPDYDRASSEALKILKKYSFTRPPVDPERIAEDEGIRVVYAQFQPPDNEKYNGFFRISDNAIVVNDDISTNRITYTIAHELGHHFLHRDYIRSNNYLPMPRRDRYNDIKPKEEIEADTFAANLLVPLFMLKEYKDFANERELARLFFVSEEVIRFRLDLLRRHPTLARAR